jgi:hypothetical protein
VLADGVRGCVDGESRLAGALVVMDTDVIESMTELRLHGSPRRPVERSTGRSKYVADDSGSAVRVARAEV